MLFTQIMYADVFDLEFSRIINVIGLDKSKDKNVL